MENFNICCPIKVSKKELDKFLYYVGTESQYKNHSVQNDECVISYCSTAKFWNYGVLAESIQNLSTGRWDHFILIRIPKNE